MELLEGESLREVILRRAPTTRQVLSWALQAAQGLSAAHAKGIVHRDIKPENLFLTLDGRIKILDFGLAKLTARTPVDRDAATESGLSVPGVIVGTVAYMSPEQIEAGGLDPRSDVFSLGDRPVRASCPRASVPPSDGSGDADGDRQRDASRSVSAPAGDPARHRPDRPALPREAAGRALPVRAGARGRARGRSRRRELGGGAARRRGEEPVPGPLVLHRGGREPLLRPRGGGQDTLEKAARAEAPRRHRTLGRGQDVVRACGRDPRAAGGLGARSWRRRGMHRSAASRARWGRSSRAIPRRSADSRTSRTATRPSSCSRAGGSPTRTLFSSSTSSRSCSRSTAGDAGALRGSPREARERGQRPRASLAARRLPDALPRLRGSRARLRSAHAARPDDSRGRCGGRSSSRPRSAGTASRTTRSWTR